MASVANGVIVPQMKYNAKLRAVDKDMKHKWFPARKAHWGVTALVVFFKIAGFATFSVTNVAASDRNKEPIFIFAPSKLGRLYNVLLISLTVGSMGISIPFRLNSFYPGMSLITQGIEVLQASLGCLTLCAMFLRYLMCDKVLVKAANRLASIDRALERLVRPINRVQKFWGLFYGCSFDVGLFVAVITTEIIAFAALPSSWLGDFIPTYIISLYLVQYFCTTSLLTASFIDVNRGMQSLARNSSADPTESLYEARRVVVSGSSLRSLVQLGNIHVCLCEICSEIAQFYALPILFGITFLFLTVVYNGYYFVLSLAFGMDAKFVLLLNTSCWILAALYPILLLTSKVTQINGEIQKLGSVVHTLLGCTVDREVRDQLKQLSLRLLHRDVRFTASGFFPLDNTLFHSILSAATTYLVIVLQFHMGVIASQMATGNCT